MDHGRHGGRGGGERGRERSRDGGPSPERGRDGGPPPEGRGPDTRFLQLEMSQVLYGEAEKLSRDALRELLFEAVKRRINERFGARIEAIGRLAADELMDEVEANLDIEARVAERQDAGERAKARVRDIFFGARGREEAASEAEESDYAEGPDVVPDPAGPPEGDREP